tara:strand:+ start:734 stop:1447 length:714 start_codon:yes stop_codon:yes gene_type:complete
MGLFSSIKKAFKKIVKGVKKVVKKVVKGVKKVVKKIGSSKILRKLAMVAAIVVTGGAALTAFGAVGGAGTLTGAIMSAGSWVSGLPVIGTIMKPFELLGTGVGNFTRGATNLVQGKGWAGANTAVPPPPPPPPPPVVPAADKWTTGARGFVAGVGKSVIAGVATGYATQKLLADDPTGEMAGLANESKDPQDPLQIYASQQGINFGDIYGQMSYGTADPGFGVGSELYRQSTYGVAA